MIKGLDKTSAQWTALKMWIAMRIQSLHSELEVPLSPAQTDLIRGRIAELRNLLSEGEPVEIERFETVNYEN